MKVVWTHSAKLRLREIHQFYKPLSERAARLLVARLLFRTKQLRSFPLSGTVEELLKPMGKDHRYLVEGKYKIIYRVEGDVVYIEDVFDCRQNPTKMIP